MEPFNTHSAPLPQQDPPRPAGGRLSLRSTDPLPPGGREDATPPAGQRSALDVVDRATAGTPHSPGVTASLLGANVNDQNNAGLPSATTCTRLDVFQLLTTESKKINGPFARPADLSKAERCCLINVALKGALHSTLSEMQQSRLDTAISSFMGHTEKRYADCRRNMLHFTKKNKDWLSKPFVYDIPKDLIKSEIEGMNLSTELQNASPVDGCELNSASEVDIEMPGCSSDAKYEQLSVRHQLRLRRKLQSVLEIEPPKKLIKVFTETIKINGGGRLSKKAARDLEEIIHECLSSPNRASELRALLGHEVKSLKKKTTHDDNDEEV